MSVFIALFSGITTFCVLTYIGELVSAWSDKHSYSKFIGNEKRKTIKAFSPKTCDEWEFQQWLLTASVDDLMEFGGYSDSQFNPPITGRTKNKIDPEFLATCKKVITYNDYTHQTSEFDVRMDMKMKQLNSKLEKKMEKIHLKIKKSMDKHNEFFN
jgi:hypothetical protein